MQKFLDIAPAHTWVVLTLASILLLLGFVLLSHGRIRSKAYGEPWSGALGSGPLESLVRVGTALVFGGLLLWGAEWGWDIPLLGLTASGCVVAAGLEIAARSRARLRSR